jgi:hypothetical protein
MRLLKYPNSINVESFVRFKGNSIIRNNINRTWVYFQGLKRSVTTLRGGTLGYAEIVAVKVRTDCFHRNVASL